MIFWSSTTNKPTMSVIFSPVALVMLTSRVGSMISRLPGGLEILLLIVLCWQLAGLFWLFFAPMTQNVELVMPRPSPDANIVSRDAFLRWYGGSAATNTPQEYSLIAVIAGKNGAAVLRKSDGSSIAVGVGAQISPDIRLLAVEPGQITIERSGVSQLIKLPQNTSPALFSNVEKTLQPAKDLPPIKITRGQMARIFQDGNLSGWDKGLSSVPDGGIRVDDAATQPLIKMLKLKSGDILKSINGRQLDQLADLSLLFHFFAQQSAVDLILVRNGAFFSSHYDIQP